MCTKIMKAFSWSPDYQSVASEGWLRRNYVIKTRSCPAVALPGQDSDSHEQLHFDQLSSIDGKQPNIILVYVHTPMLQLKSVVFKLFMPSFRECRSSR